MILHQHDRVYILFGSATHNGCFGHITDEDNRYGEHALVVTHDDGTISKYYDYHLCQLPQVKEA